MFTNSTASYDTFLSTFRVEDLVSQFAGNLQTGLNVEHILVLQAIVLRKEIKFASAEWLDIFRIVVNLLQALRHLRAVRDLVQVRERQFVLGLNPLRRFLGMVVLQPAIRIAHL